MDPAVLCSLFLLIALVAGCGGCVREADQEPGQAGWLFPEPLPTPPAVPEPWVLPTVPALSGAGADSRADPKPLIVSLPYEL